MKIEKTGPPAWHGCHPIIHRIDITQKKDRENYIDFLVFIFKPASFSVGRME